MNLHTVTDMSSTETKSFQVQVVYTQRRWDGHGWAICGNTFNVKAVDAASAESKVHNVWHPMPIQSVVARELASV